ncbi:MAG: hypothetical protein ACI4OS_02470 [Akkermansia sp.]
MGYYVGDLAWMSSSLFDQDVLSVIVLAKEELQEFHDERCDWPENIVSMPEYRHILTAFSGEEPLEKIAELLCLCREFCERSNATSGLFAFAQTRTTQNLIPLKKIDSSVKSVCLSGHS